MNSQTIFPNSRNPIQLIVPLFLAISLVAFWALGYGPNGYKCYIPPLIDEAAVTSVPIVQSEAPAPVAKDALAVTAPIVKASPAPEVKLPPIAKVYFELGSTNVSEGDLKLIAPIVAFLKANPNYSASISGFHDDTGSPEFNAKIAKTRANNVSAKMVELGIGANRLVQTKPQLTNGTGTQNQARRVEVSINKVAIQ